MKILAILLFGVFMFLMGVICTPHINRYVYGTANIYTSKSAGIKLSSNGGDSYLYNIGSPEGAVYPLYLLEKAGNYGFYENPYFNNMDNLSFIFPEGWSELSIHN